LLALIGGGLGSLLTFSLYGLKFGEALSADLAHFFFDSGLKSVFWAQLFGDFLIDLADKLLVVLIACPLLHLVPKKQRYNLRLRIWRQNPLSVEERRASSSFSVRRMSIRPKFMILATSAMIIVAVLTTAIGYSMYRTQMLNAQAVMGEGVSRVIASFMDPDRVDEYLEKGDEAPGYKESEQAMAQVRDSSADITYVYVYQVRTDGCHVVFDPDTADESGSDPGTVMPFDEAFAGEMDNLLAGRAIKPVISNTEEWGWLYTIYTPVQDSTGQTVCYACTDISMDKIMEGMYIYLGKVLSLFTSIIAILLAVFLLLADSGVIMPINTMALASSRFAFDSAIHREEGLEQLRSLGIRTGDEIENLYNAITQTTEDSVRYIAESQEKNETIALMQENLILVLADMVESRDQFTGDHVKNTSEYTLIIMNQLKKEGIYTDQLTDEFVRNVYHSAPLHDIGKIRVSDTILNKPGKLTDEEFETMKLHTVYGRDVIENAKKATPDVSYLNEAQNLALYHHEKWNGRGYPQGLSGEDIPLSARIMAVADVFDALVSKRSYKDPFPFEKAMDIIREGAGNHFDPYVAGAFEHAEAEVRKVLSGRQTEEK
jgi:HD-GYP domain-containing protein (c-di-GMP phosphodiesterase class II)